MTKWPYTGKRMSKWAMNKAHGSTGMPAWWQWCDSKSHQHWIMKHAEGICGIRKWLFIWKDRNTDECPLFSTAEDDHHVWHCLHRSMLNLPTSATRHYTDIWMDDSKPDHASNPNHNHHPAHPMVQQPTILHHPWRYLQCTKGPRWNQMGQLLWRQTDQRLGTDSNCLLYMMPLM